jgi:AraC-like DNA-binding protein
VNVVSGLVAFTCDQTAVRSVLLGLSQQWPDAIRFDMARPLMQAAWRWLEWPCGEALDSRALRGGSPAVTTALDLVARHHTRQDYGVAQIALAVGMHPSSLTRAVRQQTGRTLIAHFNQARVLTAPRLLKDPRHAVEEVAHESGFSSRSHFTRTFTRLTGVHPSKFRRLGHLESDSMP